MVVTELAPAPAPFVAGNAGSVAGLPPSARLQVRALTTVNSLANLSRAWFPPTARLQRRDGSAVQLSELRGKVVALYFSAHWCPPCKGPLLLLIHFLTPCIYPFWQRFHLSQTCAHVHDLETYLRPCLGCML